MAAAKGSDCDISVWCASIQEGLKEQVYAYSVHYTSRMNRLVAQCILNGLPERAKTVLQ